MAATALVAARVEPELKQQARAVLEKEGLTESLLIRRVYEYVVHMGTVPEFVRTGAYDMAIPAEPRDKFDDLLFELEHGPLADVDFTGHEWSSVRDLKATALEDKFGYGHLEAQAHE